MEFILFIYLVNLKVEMKIKMVLRGLLLYIPYINLMTENHLFWLYLERQSGASNGKEWRFIGGECIQARKNKKTNQIRKKAFIKMSIEVLKISD